jgi:hypothetical protein
VVRHPPKPPRFTRPVRAPENPGHYRALFLKISKIYAPYNPFSRPFTGVSFAVIFPNGQSPGYTPKTLLKRHYAIR